VTKFSGVKADWCKWVTGSGDKLAMAIAD
jgi:hypothetical protein